MVAFGKAPHAYGRSIQMIRKCTWSLFCASLPYRHSLLFFAYSLHFQPWTWMYPKINAARCTVPCLKYMPGHTSSFFMHLVLMRFKTAYRTFCVVFPRWMRHEVHAPVRCTRGLFFPRFDGNNAIKVTIFISCSTVTLLYGSASVLSRTS